MPTVAHQELCSRMMVPGSERLARIWEMLCDETDAKLLLAMPGTAQELAEKCSLPLDETARRLDELYFKGVAFESEKPQGTVFRMPRHLIQFHDASVQWPDAPEAYYDEWSGFMANEYPPLVRMILDTGFPAFMRVLPISDTIKSLEGRLRCEGVENIIEDADMIALCMCPCRLTEKAHDKASREVCIQINKGANYNIKRGTGRQITKEEALALLHECEGNGLVHFTDAKAGLGTFICNCCDCCCAILRPYLKDEKLRGILAPSRYQPRVDPEPCMQDGVCRDICPVGAITLEAGAPCPEIDADLCIGCGLCVDSCAFGALSMRQVRPPEFIPA